MKWLLAAALAACFGFAGCAPGYGLRARPYVEAKDTLFVGMPTVPAVDSSLSALGWDSARFADELRKELRFQLNRKGIVTPDDSAGAGSRLEVALDRYAMMEFSGQARLTTPAGSRDIPFAKKRKGAPENRDPTIDDIRKIAASLAEETRADPRRPGKREAPFPGLQMIF